MIREAHLRKILAHRWAYDFTAPPSFRTTIHHQLPPRDAKTPADFEHGTARTPIQAGIRIEAFDRSYVVGEAGELRRPGRHRGSKKDRRLLRQELQRTREQKSRAEHLLAEVEEQIAAASAPAIGASFRHADVGSCCCEVPGMGKAQACEEASSTFPDGVSAPGGDPCLCACHLLHDVLNDAGAIVQAGISLEEARATWRQAASCICNPNEALPAAFCHSQMHILAHQEEVRDGGK